MRWLQHVLQLVLNRISVCFRRSAALELWASRNLPGVKSAVALGALSAATWLATPLAHAEVTIVSVQNASAVEDLDETTPVIYGGVAGSITAGDCGTSLSTDSTCNSCATANSTGDNNLLACNNRRVHQTLRLKITFKSNKIESGKPTITNNSTTNHMSLTLDSGTTSAVSKDNEATVVVQWRYVCENLTDDVSGTAGPSDCEATGNQLGGSLRVGVSGDGDLKLDGGDSDDYKTVSFYVRREIGQGGSAAGVSVAKPCSDPDAVGVCYFEISSGDEKAVVRSVRAINGFPSNGNIQFKYLRVHYTEGDSIALNSAYFDQITPDSAYQDLEITGSSETNFTINPNKVSGLKNNSVYYFKAAVVDAAGNVGYYTAQADNDYCPDTASLSGCHIAIPGEVTGVFADNKCFIATAAYGSNMAHQVNTFREFRNKILLSNSWGKKFVRFYYERSPRYANMIAKSDLLRSISRVTLWPLLAFASLSLKFGTPLALLALLLALTLPVLVVFGTKRGKDPQGSERA